MISEEIFLRHDGQSAQVCSLCQNFLSKGPVMVSEEFGTTCGDCSTREKLDKSALSLYNVVAYSGFFKCNNYQNGCKAILKFYEKHEPCQFNVYPCPTCSFYGTGIQLESHFRNSHMENLYFSNHFSFTNQPFLTETFIFSHDSYLYAIEIKEPFIKFINICENPCMSEITLCFSNISKLIFSSITCNGSGTYMKSRFEATSNELIFVDIVFSGEQDLKVYKENLNKAEIDLQCKIASVHEKEAEIEDLKVEIDRKKSELKQFFRELSTLPEVLFLKEVLSISSQLVLTCHRCSAFLDKEIFTCLKNHLVCGNCMMEIMSTTVCQTYWLNYTSIFDKLKLPCDWPGCTNISQLQFYMLHKQRCKHRLYKCPAQSCDYIGDIQAISQHWHLKCPKLLVGNIVSWNGQNTKFFWITGGDFQEFLIVSVLVDNNSAGRSMIINIDEDFAVLPFNYKIAFHNNKITPTYLKQKCTMKTITITNCKCDILSLSVLPTKRIENA